MKYIEVIVGGTFDYFHDGHKALINKAFAVGQIVWLGITTDEFSRNKLSVARLASRLKRVGGQMSEYELRKKEVTDYLKKNGWLERTKLIPINDKFGTTLTDKDLESIIVSADTENVANHINELRRERNFNPLNIVTVPWVNAADGLPISSKRIRSGEIDREGNVYALPPDWGTQKITDQLRKELKKPLGILLKDKSKNHEEGIKDLLHRHPELARPQLEGSGSNYPQFKIIESRMPTQYQHDNFLIAVGDAVTDALIKENIIPDVSIVDFIIQRKPVYTSIQDLGFRDIKVHRIIDNPAGTLSFHGFEVLNQLIKYEPKPVVLQVNGEEDLLGLLAIFIAPLGSLIVYGQPNEGIVVVEVTENQKKFSREILNQFST